MIDDEVTVEGTITKIVFQKERFRIVKLKLDKGSPISVLGEFPLAGEGARVRVTGKKSRNDRFGVQIKASSILEIAPDSLAGLVAYLSGGSFAGVGRATADKLVKHFGDKSLDVLTHAPERLREVEGLTEKAASSLQKEWKKRRGIHDLMVFMREAGLGQALAESIHDRYGADALSIIRKNPYRLAREIARVGFLTADRLGKHIGIAQDSPERIAAALYYGLETGQEERGDTAFTSDMLRKRTSDLLGKDHAIENFDALFSSTLSTLVADKLAVQDTFGGVTYYYLPTSLETEKNLAERIYDIATTPPNDPVFEDDAARSLEEFETASGITLGDMQKQAVMTAAESSFMVITGGPGTGKTTILKAVLYAFEEAGLSAALASPTGRAAKRMQEATGKEAITIHRLLRYSPEAQAFRCCRATPISKPCRTCQGTGKFYDEDIRQKLDCHTCGGGGNGDPYDVVIIDETSMLDLQLAEKLIDAVPNGSRVIFVGDVDQLPSVGPGCVLRDVIQSDLVPVVRLKHIYRQAEQSLIKQNAQLILDEEMPLSDATRDFIILKGHDAEGARAKVVDLVKKVQTKGFKPHEIQVLVPQHKGIAGNQELNVALQEALNPPKGKGMDMFRKGSTFRRGDRVMHLRNNYELGVYNGEVGYVEEIEGQGLVVRYEDPEGSREVYYEGDDLDQIKLCYASTVHKSQGAEYPVVVVVVLGEAHWMLNRNLIYTAITRGQKLVVVITDVDARSLAWGISRKGSDRTTTLSQRIRRI